MRKPYFACAAFALLLTPLLAGCDAIVRATDRDVAEAIAARQRQAMELQRPVPLNDAPPIPEPPPQAYEYVPQQTDSAVPEDFAAADPPADLPEPESVELSEQAEPQIADSPEQRLLNGIGEPAASTAPATASAPAGGGRGPAALPPDSDPPPQRASRFTLLDALAYALLHRREYQTAKEDLYLAALALTLERHLWTPQFAWNLRTIYGNFGEIRDFDQAMRFVSELAMAQRLPFGGEFTARAISTLVRDVGQTITAEEGSAIELGLRVPLLRNAGLIAQEELIQLERTLTYAVRDFERFRRSQLVEVASGYFDLLRSKQDVIDAVESYKRFRNDFERALALEQAGTGTVLDTRRAETELLTAENRVEDLREQFRAQSDEFKLLIGMPVDEPLGLADLEDIDTIERSVAAGRYPLLWPPEAAADEARAIEVATQRRLDLLNREDQIDDAKRGVANAENQLLPDLDWTSSLRFDTDPEHYKLGGFEIARATWRTEVLLALPLERFRERTELRARIIDVSRARRTYQLLLDRVRTQVRAAVNRLRLEERSLAIQQRNVEVADLRREYARIQFYDGDIGNRDLVEAENAWSDARNRLNLAKTARWRAILEFRLATETLRVPDDGGAVANAAPADPILDEPAAVRPGP